MDQTEICSKCGNLQVGTPREKYQHIIRQVAARYGIAADQITGNARCSKLLHPRREVMAILQKSGLSASHIGRIMNRDHTTVLHHIRQFYAAQRFDKADAREDTKPTAAPAIFPYRHRNMAQIMREEAGA